MPALLDPREAHFRIPSSHGGLSLSIKRDVKFSHGTHLMHLEASRYALYREAQNFLTGGDEPPCAN